VPEDMNVEFAHRLTEPEREAERRERRHRILEIIEVTVLAVVAVATAWTGYQASQWDGRQALRYGQASHLRFEAETASTRGAQVLVADSAGFNTWLQAHSNDDPQLMEEIARRFTPYYRAAFDAWLKTNPFTDANAPPGPAYMPGYVNPDIKRSGQINDQASATFDDGTHARETGDKYVRDAVVFASVLFLVALAQRQRAHAARLAANGIALALLVVVMISVVSLPRL
jgi:hypothetical protein